jgi:hypothetical protein
VTRNGCVVLRETLCRVLQRMQGSCVLESRLGCMSGDRAVLHSASALGIAAAHSFCMAVVEGGPPTGMYDALHQ